MLCECVLNVCLTDSAIDVPDDVQKSPHLDANEYIVAVCTVAQWSKYCSKLVFELVSGVCMDVQIRMQMLYFIYRVLSCLDVCVCVYVIMSIQSVCKKHPLRDKLRD